MQIEKKANVFSPFLKGFYWKHAEGLCKNVPFADAHEDVSIVRLQPFPTLIYHETAPLYLAIEMCSA